MTPTRRVALVLVVLAVVTVAVPVGLVVALAAVVVVFGLAAGDALAARGRRPTVERSTQSVVARGAVVALRVVADAGAAGSVAVGQPVPDGLELRPWRSNGPVLDGRLTARDRGVHQLPPVVVRASGPLGLARRDWRVGQPVDVSVLPDLPAARRHLRTRRGSADDDGRARNRLGLGTELESVRDYAPDDDVRQINWVATARVGRPMSNLYRLDDNRDLVCLVDHGRLMAAPAGDGTRLDVALDALAVLAVAAEDAGDRVGTVAFADTVSRVLRPRRRNAEAAVRTLFDLQPVDVESAYDRAFQTVDAYKRSLVVLFSDLLDDAAARSLADAFPVLARHHAVVAATCRDPDLAAAVDAAPEGRFDVLRASVAVDVLAGRARAVRLLRRLGAVVVEADPGRLGPACVDAYVRLKRQARL